MNVCRIGVTGHRTYHDPVGTQRSVDAALAHAVDGAGEVHFWTSLAEGADQVVAERIEAARPDTQLHVVLPLGVADYCADFASPGSIRTFHRVLAGATSVRVTGPDAGGTRESAYERAGRAVVDEVDTLIAVWDGKPARGRGGTAQMVDYAHEIGCDVVVIPVTRS